MSAWKVLALATLVYAGVINSALGDVTSGCPSMESCTLICPYGLLKDSNNCQTCTCNNPCQGYDCGQYEMCDVRVLPCAAQDPCPPQPVCVPKTGNSSTAFPSTRNVDLCLYSPDRGTCDGIAEKYFFNVSAMACQKFVYSGCGGNGNNFNSLTNCLARCLPTSVQCQDVSCASPCQLQYDSKGCNVCVCPGATCKDVQCQANQQCVIVEGQCSSSSQVCYSMPQCQTQTSIDAGGTTTPRCPYIECELHTCQYGFKPDQYGCKSCLCVDPCETFECSVGQVCAITPNDCTSGTECRDPPMRYCTDATQAPVTRTMLTNQELISCCATEQMSPSCLPLCVPDLSVSSQNAAMLLGCTSEFTKYLKCAGGGESYTSCCAKKGVGSSCLGFCAGNATIDTTNPHLFSECMMSNDLNDVISCYIQGQPDSAPTTTPSLMTPSGGMTSRQTTAVFNLGACTLNPEVGPCDSVLQRWFFNPDTLTCQSFNYGGCGGNLNNFLTKLDCILMCMADDPRCPEIMCQPDCEIAIGRDGCNTCLCPTAGSSMGMSATDGMTTTTTRPTTTMPRSLTDCCMDNGVPDMCMPFCSFAFDFDASQVSRLLACQQYINIGIQCAMGGKTYSKCCSSQGVTGQCLEACGGHVNISDVNCLVDDHSVMLSCFANERADSDNICTPVTCQNNCTYGTVKDSNGCKTCNCLDSCKTMMCPAGKVCTYEPYADCTGDICWGIAYRGVCTNATDSCPTLAGCNNSSCLYGRAKDSNNCEICDCYDPCKGSECASGTSCSVETCTNCTTPFIGVCKATCKRMMCARGCEFDGVNTDAFGCPTCNCNVLCQNVTCEAGKVCKVEYIEPQPSNGSFMQAVCKAENECLKVTCETSCPNGNIRDMNGCETCACFEPCQNMTCETGTACRIETVTATADYPYSVVGKCQPYVECSHVMCSIFCEFGFQKDDNYCPVCSCYEPCANVQCNPGYTCKTQPTTEADNSKYNVKGVCAFDHCVPPPCNHFCQYGMTLDANGCQSQTCECADPCKNVTCDNVSICQPMRINDRTDPPFNYMGQCVQCTGMLCDHLTCDYGQVLLSSKCSLCECFEPCKNLSCTEFETCEVKSVNSSASYLQSYVGQCVSKGCPTVICSNVCQFGYQTNAAGCETCDCVDPCQNYKCLTGLVCEPRQDPSCTGSSVCTRPPLAVCVTPPNPCRRQQMVDYEQYSGQDNNAAQLNCDMNGNYKPLQCLNDLDCRCSAPNGFSNYNGLTRDQAIALCYPEDKILGLMRMYADISIIQPGSGSFFKQNISKQIADLLGMSDSNVTITQYRSGSILIDFLASDNNRLAMDAVQATLLHLQATNQMIPVEYNGQHYHATLDSFQRIGPYNIPSTPAPENPKSLTRAELLVIVIVIPVVCALLLGLCVGFCVFKCYKREKPLISDSVRSSMSFDSVMEKGPKASYENPTYDNTKVRPVSGTFPNDSTTSA